MKQFFPSQAEGDYEEEIVNYDNIDHNGSRA